MSCLKIVSTSKKVVEKKKTDIANLELLRREMFLTALVLVLSFVYAALNWDSSISEEDYDKMIEDAIENIDFSKLKKNNDMVAAISETDNPQEVTMVKPGETVLAPQQEVTSSELLVGEGEGEVPEAVVEEVKPQILDIPENKNLPEGFHVVEALPEFPGGATAFMKWLTANLKYPTDAQKRKLEGKVVVSFIVDTEGNVTHLKVDKSPNVVFTQEVIKVMNKMPKWRPGIQNGQFCSTMVSVPINFDL